MIYTSRATTKAQDHGLKRGAKLHRVVVERQLLEQEYRTGVKVELGFDSHIHHQNFVKTCACSWNLVIMPSCLNPTGALRDPYTGEFLSKDQWVRRYGAD